MSPRLAKRICQIYIAIPDDFSPRNYIDVDDAVVMGSLPMLMRSTDPLIRDFSRRLWQRDPYRCIDIHGAIAKERGLPVLTTKASEKEMEEEEASLSGRAARIADARKLGRTKIHGTASRGFCTTPTEETPMNVLPKKRGRSIRSTL